MSTFNGFQSPNFTQIPNEYLDYTFSPESDLSKVQMQIMNFVFRETFGWQDKHKILVFSAADIMALLNLKKKNTVVDALNGLVEDRKFLEVIEVLKLSKKARANIEKSIERKLQPRQKIYRLNLIEGNKRPWDNVEEPHTNIHERKLAFKSSNQMVTSNEKVTTGGNQMVTTSSNQMVTTLEPESVGTLGANESLNKGLNKGLNKKEEEEEGASYLLDNPSLKTLNDLAVKANYAEDVAMEIVSHVNDKKITNLTEAVIKKAFKEVQEDLDKGFPIGDMAKWTAGKIEIVSKRPKLNIEIKSPENPKNLKKPQPKYGSDKSKFDFTRKEPVPEWMPEVEEEWKAAQQEEAEAPEVDQEERKRMLEENLKKLRA